MDTINLAENINCKYLIQTISSFIPTNYFMNIIKYSKHLQEISELPLYSYQKYFIQNTININWNEENIDKISLFLLNEFNLYIDKKNLKNIAAELKKEKKAFNINKYPYSILHVPKINWDSINPNITMLDLSNYEMKEYKSLNSKYDNNKRIKIPTGIFPSLRILGVQSNFIIPVSMLIYLTELILEITNIHKLLFFNDINKPEIALQKLEKLVIMKAATTYYIKIEDENKQKESYKIKLKCPNLQNLIMGIIPDKFDISFLNDYFDFELLNNIFNIKNNNKNFPDKKFDNIKKMVLDYNFGEKLKYFDLEINLYEKNARDYNSNFIMEKFNNGLKSYSFSVYRKNDGHGWNLYSEDYEENQNNNKVVKKYEDMTSIDYNKEKISIKNLDYINCIAVNGKNLNKIEDLLLIEKNNYSLQEISLEINDNNFNYYLKNISNFRMLKKILVFFNKETDSDILIQLVKDISKLYLMETIAIKYKGNLSKNQKNIIKSLIKNCQIREDDSHFYPYYKIIKNYDIDSDDFDWYFNRDSFY